MSKRVQVVVSDEDHRLMVAAAGILGVGLSEYLRRKLKLGDRVVGRPAVVGGSVIGSPEYIESMLRKTREVRSAVDAFASEEPAKTELIMEKTLSTAAEMNAVYQDVEVVYDNPADDPD